MRRLRRHRQRSYNRYSRFSRRNPDHGPTLYNPLTDKNHSFKNDSAYKKIIRPLYSKKRRNPDPFHYGAGEDTTDGVYGPIFRGRRRRNPDSSEASAGGRGLFKSLFARRRRNPGRASSLRRRRNSRRRYNPSLRRRRRNPLGYTFEEGRGLYKSIFSRRRNPSPFVEDPNTQIFNQNVFARSRRRRNRHNPVGAYELPTYDHWDTYWDRGRI